MTGAELRNRLHAKTDAMLATIDRVTEPESSGPHWLAHTDTGHIATYRCRDCGLAIYRSNLLRNNPWTGYYVTPSTTCPGYELDNPPEYPWEGTRHTPIYQPESKMADYAGVGR